MDEFDEKDLDEGELALSPEEDDDLTAVSDEEDELGSEDDEY